ncbi:hypothetical protein BDR26DRAFT_707414 [Obelidium mucronatum]|nr:hypothetical protein BDR26DRAFT_707414 [Obelidium mucronatum]
MSDVETNFRNAALAVTNLYRSAQAEKAASFDDGYASCFDDLLATLASSTTTTTTTTTASNNSHPLIDSLVSFFSAKQDVLNPSAAESLHNLIEYYSTAKQQQQQSSDSSVSDKLQTQAQSISSAAAAAAVAVPPPPVFTFTATPSQTGLAAHEFHKAHPILPFRERQRVFGGLRTGAAGGGGGGFGGAAAGGGGGRRRGGAGFSNNNSGFIDFNAVFSGVDFGALGFGDSGSGGGGGGDLAAAEGLSSGDGVSPAAAAVAAVSIESKTGGGGGGGEVVSSEGGRTSGFGNRNDRSNNEVLEDTTGISSLKRRWTGQTVVPVSSSVVAAGQEYVGGDVEDHLMMDDLDVNCSKRARWRPFDGMSD